MMMMMVVVMMMVTYRVNRINRVSKIKGSRCEGPRKGTRRNRVRRKTNPRPTGPLSLCYPCGDLGAGTEPQRL
jgi:hypothetical protein